MASSNGSATLPGARIAPAAPLTTRPSYLTPVRPVSTFDEIGTTGLRQYGGYVLEEWLQQLAGRKAAWAYREMIDNDPVVGGILFAINMLARKVSWWAEGNDERAEFVWSCMHDMSQTWVDFVCEALSMVPYGYSFHETVYKRREGMKRDTWQLDPPSEESPQTEEANTPASSQYTDGRIGWRKHPVRAQETLNRWRFDGYSGIRAFEQIDWHGGNHTIPIEKALLFRTQTTRNNPEGRSILRNSWIPYYSLKNIQALEAIGIERDLAGIPVATPPEGLELFADSHKELLQEVRAMVTSIRRDEYEGIVLPTSGWKLELLHSGGQRQIDTDKIVRRYEQRIASSILADFILIGQDAIGSYAMVDVKSDLFGIAMDTILDLICEPMNRYGIPRLLALNGYSVEDPPQIRHSSAGRIDLEKVGSFFRDINMAGAPIPWSKELIGALFTEAGLPAKFDGALETREHPTGDVQRIGEETEAARPAELTKAAGVVDIAPVLAEHATMLSGHLERDLHGALTQLGEEAATSYLTVAEKAEVAKARMPNVARLAARVVRSLNLQGWVRDRLGPILRNHAGRVAGDTQRVLQTEVDAETHLGVEQVQKLEDQAGHKLSAADIEPQVREAIMRAIDDGMKAGEHPSKIAGRIRGMVPKGPFVHAGSGYRAQLISRSETLHQQRAATLAAYQDNPRISKVEVVDGIFGPPRSDETCIDRAGETIPLDEAAALAPELHPQCTVSYNPVVG